MSEGVHTPHVLELRDIHKSFGDLDVLKGVSINASEGEVVCLIGSSGSGKSTLLRCANLLEIPQSGDLIFRGKPVAFKGTKANRKPSKPEEIRALRSRLTMVFQQFNLWAHLTILENVTEAPIAVHGMSKQDAEAKALKLLEQVGIADKANNYPSQLSGGQQQRAAIARALAMEPDAILFDEPTSALDPELEAEVIKVIKALAEEGRTMLIVTHDMGLARDLADRVIFLHNGKIEEEGPPAAVLDSPKSVRLQKFLNASVAV